MYLGRLRSKEKTLVVSQLNLTFGGVDALVDVSISVLPKEVVAIIGPNGAGKTSLVNCISGYYKPISGKIVLDNTDITGQPPYKIASLGIGRTFQNIELYVGMSTLDNMLIGRHLFMKSGAFASLIYFGKAHSEELRERRKVEEIIDLLELQPYRKATIDTLPYGLRKRVELGRCLALEPSIMLLDEPLAGMNIDEKEDMCRYIIDVNELTGCSVVIIEHDMSAVMDLSQRVVVLDFGVKIAEGSPDEIKQDERVIKAYLGGKAAG